MPPDIKVSKQAKLSAKIKGVVMSVPKSATLKLIGEKLTWAIAGFPIENIHHGTKTEMAISTRVNAPAISPIKLTFLSMKLNPISI